MSDWVDECRRCPFEPPDASQTPSAVSPTFDQAANGRNSLPLQAPGRAHPGLVAEALCARAADFSPAKAADAYVALFEKLVRVRAR